MISSQKGNWTLAVVFLGLCVVAATIAATRTRAASPAADGLEARVVKLEDEAAVRNLLVEYGNDLDTQDLVGYSRLFAKDGTWSGSTGFAKGPDAILAMLQKALGKSSPYDPSKVRSFHLLTNFYIQVNGDHATARSKWTFFGRTEDNKLEPRLAGHYDDTFVREGEVWKFQSRIAPLDIPSSNEVKSSK